MHVHGPRFNPDYQMAALAAAARAEARRQAEQTRRKLLSASSLLGDSEDEGFVVTLQSRQEDEQTPSGNGRGKRAANAQLEDSAEAEDDPFSDYA